jgi:hypothetical protein
MSMYDYVAFIISFILVTLSYIFFIQESFAVSPPFSLQGIYNNHSDWSLEKTLGYSNVKNISECTTQQHRFLSPHIAAADYISDGKTLNATLWLSSPFKVPSISSSSGFKQIERTYAMLIHIDSAYDIGQNYQAAIQWSSLTNTWSKITKKSSPPFVVKTGNEEILDQKDNYTNFFRSGKNYVDLPLNLGFLGYPYQYSIISYASDTYLTKDYHICHLKDITSVVHIPPPEFIISTLPNSVNLFPGENKSIELRIKSNTNLNSHATIYTNQTEDKGIMITPSPRDISIIPSGIASSLLETKASENAKAHPYTIPIYITISFPTAVTNWLSGNILANPQSAIINKISNFTITVHQPLSFQEQLKNIWESWGAPINGVVGIITAISGGGIAGLVYKKLRHDKRRDKRYQEKK